MRNIKKNCGVHFLTNLIIDLDKIECVATTCSFDEAHAFFFCSFVLFCFVLFCFLAQVIFKGENSAGMIL